MNIGDKVLVPANYLGEENGQATLSLPHLTAVVGVSQITTPSNKIVPFPGGVTIQYEDYAAVWGS